MSPRSPTAGSRPDRRGRAGRLRSAFGRPLVRPGLLALGLAVLALLVAGRDVKTRRIAVPLPLAVYDIETDSGGRHVSMANQPIARLGIVLVPKPVDVDGDGSPDIVVSVNLVDAQQLLTFPPRVGQVLTPNITIDRAPLAVASGKPSPPLRVQVKLTVLDATGQQPPTVARLGYDTGPGGSIPPHFIALAGGIDKFFNPLEARVNTGPTLATGPPTYEGPLQLVGSVTQGDTNAALNFAYRPLPADVHLTYLRDQTGQHLTYGHTSSGDIDLTTTLGLASSTGRLDLTSRVDRLPSPLSVDVLTQGDASATSGSLDYRADVHGRAPDVGVALTATSPGTRPVAAKVDIEALPARMHADWGFSSKTKTAGARFDAAGGGIGAIDADVRNFTGPSVLPPYVPEQQQFVNLQEGPGDNPDAHISARVERIRHLDFARAPSGGIDANADMGDGVLPLLAHLSADDRGGQAGRVLEATTTISPLPDHAHVGFVPPPADASAPLTVTYDTSQSVSVDTKAEVRLADAGASCGTHGTICAALQIRRVPTHIEARVSNRSGDAHVDVDAVPRPGAAPPDLSADATMVQADGRALVAHAELAGLPKFVRILAHRGADDGLQGAEFHACDWSFTASPPGCQQDPGGRIGALSFGLRNFVERPANLPEAMPSTPLFATLTARPTQDGGAPPSSVTSTSAPDPTAGMRFDATGRFTDIAEVDFRAVGRVFGIRTQVGGGKDFSTLVDLQGVRDPSGGDQTALVDLSGTALVQPLPAALDVCFRGAGAPISAPSKTFTTPCENGNPFNDAGAPTRSPLSIGYHASSTFAVHSRASVVRHGGSPADDARLEGRLDVENLPGDLTAHIDTPPTGQTGPIRAVYDAPTAGAGGAAQVNIDFSGSVTDGDLVCGDPRTPAKDKHALCVAGRLEHLPTHAQLAYDPGASANNLEVETSGNLPLDLKNIDFSSVSRDETTGQAAVLEASGQLLGLPSHLTGTLSLPSNVQVDATPPLGHADLTVRSFVGPDPLPPGPPAQRDGVPTADQNASFLERQIGGRNYFRADLHAGDVAGAGFSTEEDAGHKPLGTTLMRVDFGQNHTVRAYADAQFLADEQDPTSLRQVLADVTLHDVPAGVNICIRGAGQPGLPAQPNYCDNSPVSQGAVSFVGRPGSDTTGLDIFGFVRTSQAGGSDVLAARLDLTNVPFVVQGTFDQGGKKANFAGFKNADANGVGVEPAGIGQIGFDMANADIDASSGFAAPFPWGPSRPSTVVSPPVRSGQYVGLAASDNGFRLRGSVGDTTATDGLRSVAVSDQPCPAPGSNSPDPSLFPQASQHGPAASYACVKLGLAPGGNSTPLAIDASVDRGGTHMALHDGGLSRVPDFFQATLTTTSTTDEQGALRRPCGPGHRADANPDCMPPLLRLDSPGDVVVSGVLEVGNAGGVKPPSSVQFANLDALPTASAWSDWGTDPLGVRATVKVQGGPAVRAGLRLHVPASLTVDQVQSWDAGNTLGPHFQASDTRFHYMVAKADGGPQPGLGGEVAGLIELAPGQQVLLSSESDPRRGIGYHAADQLPQIPGELGLDIYLRHLVVPEGINDTDRTFVQLDGRTSQAISARARLLGGVGGIGTVDAVVKNLPANAEGDSLDAPSFRLRADVALRRKEADNPLLCIVFCVKTGVGLNTVNATFDFGPTATPARRVDAYLAVDAPVPQIGLEVRGYASLDGTDAAAEAPISGSASIVVDPLDVFLHAIPVIGSFDMVMLSRLTATVTIDKAKEFRVWDDLLHVKAEQRDGGAGSKLAVAFEPHLLTGVLNSFFTPLLYGFTFMPPATPATPAKITFLPCGSGSGINQVPVGGGISVYGWPVHPIEPRFVTYGVLGNFDLLGRIISPLFCLAPTDLPLIGTFHPGLPFVVAHHPVPGMADTVNLPPAPPPPPTPPALDLASGPPAAYCGNHAFESATVRPGATLRVATTPGPNCTAADVGTLALTVEHGVRIDGAVDASAATGEVAIVAKNLSVGAGGSVRAGIGKVSLSAEDNLAVAGKVVADGVSTTTVGGTGPTGNSGAGHARRGGNGGAGGTGGSDYYDGSLTLHDGVMPIEAGSAGAGPGRPGAGGGTLTLTAKTMSISGLVSANGAPGSDNHKNADPAADCSSPIGSRVAGAGGGSGGGIVIGAITADLTEGTLEALGGDGGSGTAGGGGGGGGGIVKMVATELHGNRSVTATSQGGANLCPDTDAIHAGHGGDVPLQLPLFSNVPASRAGPLAQFWNHNDGGFLPHPLMQIGLKVPYIAAAGATSGFQVVLCGAYRPPEAAMEQTPNFGIQMAVQAAGVPCGVSGDLGTRIVQLGTKQVNGVVSPPDDVITTPVLQRGFWGLYTRILTPGHATQPPNDGTRIGQDRSTNDCSDPTDFTLTQSGTTENFDIADCVAEPLRGQPDMVVGVDTTAPQATVTAPALSTTPRVTLTVNAADDMPLLNSTGRIADMSGVASVACSSDGVTYVGCPTGQSGWDLGGSGRRIVHLRVIDHAGNVTDATAAVMVDAEPPSSKGEVVPDAPDGANGWYTGSPAFRISGYVDPPSGGTPGSGAPTTGRYRYWFDGGAHATCDTDCTLTPNLTLGAHVFHWQAVDVAGNLQKVGALPVNVDGEPPQSALLPVPTAPDGADGWYTTRPTIVLSAVDQPGGSGLVGPGAGLSYSVDGGAVRSYDAPFQLAAAGQHDVCWQAVDAAGNVDPPGGGQRCRHFKVDDAAPSASIKPAPATPGGANGWYTAAVPVSFGASDPTPGAGTLSTANSPSCPDPAVAPAASPAGICVSLDSAPFVAWAGQPLTVGEGLHVVRAYAVDGSGRHSAVVIAPFAVDLSHPVSAARMMPPSPAQNGWWRTPPSVVLRATDGGSGAGVSVIRYRFDGGDTKDYEGPFPVPSGVRTVTFQAFDRSGPANTEPAQTVAVQVDVTPPTVAATAPDPTFRVLASKTPTKLQWTLSDDLSHTVRVTALVYNGGGALVRRLDDGTRAVTPGTTIAGFTTWDGRDGTLSGLLPLGTYYYRVVVTDEAGNVAQSTESAPLQLRVL